VLQWARAHGCPWYRILCETAARRGYDRTIEAPCSWPAVLAWLASPAAISDNESSDEEGSDEKGSDEEDGDQSASE
jgi:hypothetical protein